MSIERGGWPSVFLGKVVASGWQRMERSVGLELSLIAAVSWMDPVIAEPAFLRVGSNFS